LCDGNGVIVPTLIGYRLEVPSQLTGIDVERNDGTRVQIVSGAPLRVEHVHRIAGAEIGKVRLRIERRLGPHAAAAKRDSARVCPGFRPRLARCRDHGKPPKKLASVSRKRSDVATTALVASGRPDQDLILYGERR